ARRSIDDSGALQRVDQLVERVDDESGPPVDQELGDGPARSGDDRRAARERFDHDEPERLWPVDREQQRLRLPEEPGFVRVADLADELDQWIVEQRPDVALEVSTVGGIDLRGDL